MTEEIAFGKCLNGLLMARGWSAARLAKELNLDSSYVRRWVRGDRVPSIESNYVEQVVNCLCGGMDASGIKRLKENYVIVLEELGQELDKEKDIYELVKDSLSKSQMYSLKLKIEERVTRSASTDDDIVSLLGKLRKNNKEPKNIRGIIDNLYNLNSTQSIITGRQNILFSYIALLKAAVESNNTRKGEILITFQSDRYPYEGYPELEAQWLDCITGVLADGWHINHVIRLNKNTHRSVKLIKRIIQQLEFYKQYQAFYFQKYITFYPAFEFFIVEGIGALVCFSTADPEYIDTAFFISEIDTIQYLRMHFHNVLKLTQPLIKVYDSVTDYNIYSTETLAKRGDYLVMSADFDAITIPYPLWEKYFKRSINSEQDRTFYTDMAKRSQDAFNQQLTRYKFMNILPVHAVEYLIKNKQYIYENIFRIPSHEDIIEHLENIIYLLKTYENFEIGLVGESQSELVTPPYWTVKGDYSVDIAIASPKEYKPSQEDKGAVLVISEGTIAGSFRDYFYDLWEKILPKYRNKEYVIDWFEERLEWFKKENI